MVTGLGEGVRVMVGEGVIMRMVVGEVVEDNTRDRLSI